MKRLIYICNIILSVNIEFTYHYNMQILDKQTQSNI